MLAVVAGIRSVSANHTLIVVVLDVAESFIAMESW